MIRNSKVHFIIRNSNFFNSSGSGIGLINVNNSMLTDINTTFNEGNGIFLINCNNNTLFGNNCKFNYYNGIYLHERVINLITSKMSEEFLRYGIELDKFNKIGIRAPEGAQELFELEKEKTKVKIEGSRGNLENLI